MENLSSRFGLAYKSSPYDSMGALSRDSGCSPARASQIAKGMFDTSKDGPGVFGLWRMAVNMGVSLDFLLPPPVTRPSVTEFFSYYSGPNTPIENFSEVIDFCDIYDKPSRGKTRLLQVGSSSMLAEKSKSQDVELLQIQYEAWPSEQRKRIYDWQKLAWHRGCFGEPEFFLGDYRSSTRRMEIPLFRSACRVVHDSAPRLLVFCLPMKMSEAVHDRGEH